MSPHEPISGPPSSPQASRQTSRRTRDPEPRLGLSFTQLSGSALAAASAAFGASYLGVAGTIIGAAVASVIATLATAMYTSSLRRTHEVVQSTVTQWTRTAATAPVVDPNAPLAETGEPSRRLPWARLSMAAAAVLAITLGAVTGVEGIAGKPLANILGGSDATGTSLGSVGSGGGSGAKHRTRTSTSTDSATGGTTSTPTTTPTAQPTPAAEPSAEPTSPAATPTDGPTSGPSADPTATPTPGS